jgi:hypothetical protein
MELRQDSQSGEVDGTIKGKIGKAFDITSEVTICYPREYKEAIRSSGMYEIK